MSMSQMSMRFSWGMEQYSQAYWTNICVQRQRTDYLKLCMQRTRIVMTGLLDCKSLVPNTADTEERMLTCLEYTMCW